MALISKKMNAALNEQIVNEFGASIQYVSIATYFDGDGLPALAKHFYRQAEEEREHAMKFVKYIVDADGKIDIGTIAAPKNEFASAEEAVQLSLEWEMTVTRQINNLVDLAIQEKDHISKNMLDWFVSEQLEEVSSMDMLLRMIRRAGERGLFFVENFLLERGESDDGDGDDD
jgi:ferritin